MDISGDLLNTNYPCRSEDSFIIGNKFIVYVDLQAVPQCISTYITSKYIYGIGNIVLCISSNYFRHKYKCCCNAVV